MVKLYYMPCSQHCRSVMLAARALGVELDLERVDLFRGEHKSPEYREINIAHTIPVMDDDGFVMNESRAIMCYLADKYGKDDDDSLYPKDPQQRAVVNQRLYYDIGTLQIRFVGYYFPAILSGTDPDESMVAPLEEAFIFLDKFLEDSPWVAGDKLTLADMSIVTTVHNCQVLGFDLSRYPNVSRWLENARETMEGFDEIEQEGVTEFKHDASQLSALARWYSFQAEPNAPTEAAD